MWAERPVCCSKNKPFSNAQHGTNTPDLLPGKFSGGGPAEGLPRLYKCAAAGDVMRPVVFGAGSTPAGRTSKTKERIEKGARLWNV